MHQFWWRPLHCCFFFLVFSCEWAHTTFLQDHTLCLFGSQDDKNFQSACLVKDDRIDVGSRWVWVNKPEPPQHNEPTGVAYGTKFCQHGGKDPLKANEDVHVHVNRSCWDSTSGEWETASEDMVKATRNGQAAVFSDGQTCVMGGMGSGLAGNMHNDPNLTSWHYTAEVPSQDGSSHTEYFTNNNFFYNTMQCMETGDTNAPWVLKASAPTPRAGGVATILKLNGEEQFCVSGGVANFTEKCGDYAADMCEEFNLYFGSVLTDVFECYDRKNNEWTKKKENIYARYGAGGANVNGKFYIVGGATLGDLVEEAEHEFHVVEAKDLQDVTLTDSVEIYNALQNKWVVGPTFPKKIYRPVVFSLQGDGASSQTEICVVHGYYLENGKTVTHSGMYCLQEGAQMKCCLDSVG